MKLSDTQLVVLNTACQRTDHRVLPLPSNLKGGAAEKVIASLIGEELVKEIRADPSDPVWRKAEDDQCLTLVLTRRAFEALGVEPEEGAEPATGAPQAASAKPGKGKGGRARKAAAARPAPEATKTRSGTKQAVLIEMLRAPSGTTIEEIMNATG